MSTILFEVQGRYYQAPATAQFAANTLYFDPVSGEVWARTLRGLGWHWIAQPSSLTYLDQLEEFPRSCPGSLIGAAWIDTFLWSELPEPLLHRELTVLETAVQRLTSRTPIWYNNHSRNPQPWEQSMQPTAELIQRLAQARYKLARGELSNEELREALKDLRQHRMSAAEVSAKSRSSTSAKTVDADALLQQFLS